MQTGAPRTAIVITTINAPTKAVIDFAEGARPRGVDVVLIGDEKSPKDFAQDGARYFSLQAQRDSGFTYGRIAPARHYARKNLGYLEAIRAGAEVVVDTDDDNIPLDSFWAPRTPNLVARRVDGASWVNVYAYYTDAPIWPRGLPLDRINAELPAFEALPAAEVDCPIQQGLANANPDVDAIYRLVLPLPQDFRGDRRVALAPGAWCPFNSQNTTWWPDAYPLLYLPAYCSFRMTDIWRSFVAQRVAAANGWHVLFHEPTVWQDRNEHDLMRDFADEMPGYLNNERIRRTLEDLPIVPGVASIPANLRMAYKALVSLGVIGEGELALLEAWLDDLAAIGPIS